MKNDVIKLRIKVIENSTKAYFKVEGDVIRWGIGVGFFFGDPTNLHMQVPCVILDCGGKIKVVNLQMSDCFIDIERMK